MNATDLPLSQYAQASVRDADGPQWFRALRQNGLAEYQRQGVPNKRVERWKYTSPQVITQTDWVPASGTLPHHVDDSLIVEAVISRALSLEGYVCVLVNGFYNPNITQQIQEKIGDFGLGEGVAIAPLYEQTQGMADSLNGFLGSLLSISEHPFAALNTSFASDGIVIRVDEGVRVSQPLHVISVTCGGGDPLTIQPRIMIDAACDSSLSVVESHVSADEGPVFANWVREVRLADRAHLNHVVMQDMNVASVWLMGSQVVLGRDSALDDFSLIRGAALSRTDLCFSLSAVGAREHVHGAYAVGHNQHSDTTTFVDHEAPNCSSSQVWKGILDANGSGVFQGKVLVRRDAQQTDGQQLHKALMLSKGAEVNTKPELMIYADDVKCSHGAATGALDEEALFYLKARGITDEVARALLVEGFLEEVLDLVPEENLQKTVRDRLQSWLAARVS